MKRQKTIRFSTVIVLFVMLFSAIQLKADSEQQDKWVRFHNNISPEAKRFHVTLQYSPSGNNFCSFSQQIKAEGLPKSQIKDGFTQKIDIPSTVDGYQYQVLLREADELCFMSRDAERIFQAQILRWKNNETPEIIKEGYMMPNREIEIPFEIPGSQANLPATETVSGIYRINIYGGDRAFMSGNFNTNVSGQLTGSVIVENAVINVSVSGRESLKLNERVINLDTKPLDENIKAVYANGKVTDIISAGNAKIAVEAMARDSSEIILAVISGDITIIKGQEQSNPLILNKPIPNFSRVELIQRKFLSLDDIKSQAGANGHIVMIFGEFKENLVQGMPGMVGMPGMPGGGELAKEFPVDESIMFKILKENVEKPLLVAFVCKRIPFSNLYGKWLDKDIEFLILSDFANPMDTIWPIPNRSSRHPSDGMMSRETLRESLGIADNRIAVILLNGKGELVYVNKDAGQKFTETLSEVNTMIKKKKKIKE